jgi:F-type H+-transporting ATPase subunit b
MLDDRIKKIETDLAEAEALRAEAKALLEDYARRREEAEKEAEDIVTAAREEAFRLTAEAKSSLEAMVARREKAVADKIAQAEAQAVVGSAGPLGGPRRRRRPRATGKAGRDQG